MKKYKSVAVKLNGVHRYLSAPKADINKNIIYNSETSNIRRTLLNNKIDKLKLR